MGGSKFNIENYLGSSHKVLTSVVVQSLRLCNAWMPFIYSFFYSVIYSLDIAGCLLCCVLIPGHWGLKE